MDWQITGDTVPLNAKGVFYIIAKYWSGISSGHVFYHEEKNRNRICVDAGGIYDFWECPVYLPFKEPPKKLLEAVLSVGCDRVEQLDKGIVKCGNCKFMEDNKCIFHHYPNIQPDGRMSVKDGDMCEEFTLK